MDKVTPKDVFQANRDRAAPLLAKLKSRGHRPHDRRQDGAVDLGPDVRDEIPGRRHGAGVGRARQCRRHRPCRDRGRDAPSNPGATCRRRRGRNCCIAWPTRSRTTPTTSRCSNASTPARPTASWPRPRSGRPRISASSPTDAPRPATASTRPPRSTGTSRPGCRSARSASSRRGTRRSCCRPGRSRRRWPPAARSCTSRRNGRR